MFRDIEKLPFFPDYLKLDAQNTRKMVRIKKGIKTNKPTNPTTTQTHKSNEHKQKKESPKLPNNFLPVQHPISVCNCFRDKMVWRQGNEGADLQQTLLKSVRELKHNCPLMQCL